MSTAHPPQLNRRQVFVAGALCGATALAGCEDDGRLRLRMATDVNTRHLLSQTLRTFGETLSAAFPDQLRVELFPSGQMYYDRDLARALMRGDLDMAAPTITTLSRIVPECGVTSLPAFYGREVAAFHRVSDGPVGQDLGRRLHAKLGVMPLYPYVDLGYVDLFLREQAALENIDPVGLKVRIFSGAANVVRLRALGAYPVMMPFADVPMALAQGAVDALETTNETMRTAQLWDAGVRGALEQHSSFLQYLPLVGQKFWDAAAPALREGVVSIWRETCEAARASAAARQADAKRECQSNGVRYRTLDAAEHDQLRARLEPVTARIVSHLRMDMALVRQAIAAGVGA